MIYEKKYPHIHLEDFERLYAEKRDTVRQSNRRDAEEFINEIVENTVFVLIPERIEECACFIERSKEIAEFYEMDVVIKECSNCISTSLRVECYGDYPRLKEVILLADEMRFAYKDEAVILTLDYYTHAAFQSGRKITPF